MRSPAAGAVDTPATTVAMTGASGLIGGALGAALAAHGHRVLRLVRHAPRSVDEAQWTPETGVAEPRRLAGAAAVVHLAGAGIADRRWSESRKRLLRASRVTATRSLALSLALLERPPDVLVMASAIGFYGDRGDEILVETSEAGRGFLAELAREWEEAASPARARGIRVVPLRFGLVLSSRGGVLRRLVTPYRLGVGGVVGRPEAWWSWIAIDDVVGLALHAIATPSLNDPVNATSPHPVRNKEFARALGRALRRPSWIPVPAFALRLLFGEMADEAILSSARVEPRRALASGYRFRLPELDAALEHVLGPARV